MASKQTTHSLSTTKSRRASPIGAAMLSRTSSSGGADATAAAPAAAATVICRGADGATVQTAGQMWKELRAEGL